MLIFNQKLALTVHQYSAYKRAWRCTCRRFTKEIKRFVQYHILFNITSLSRSGPHFEQVPGFVAVMDFLKQLKTIMLLLVLSSSFLSTFRINLWSSCGGILIYCTYCNNPVYCILQQIILMTTRGVGVISRICYHYLVLKRRKMF